MSGGIVRVLRDSAADFSAWRKETFGFELAPLPQSLKLSAAETQLAPIRQPARAAEYVAGG
jgi:hypothetical protein